MTTLARYSKLIAALVGAAGVAVSDGLLPGATAKWVAIVVTVLTALGVYIVPNKPTT